MEYVENTLIETKVFSYTQDPPVLKASINSVTHSGEV